MAMTLVVRSGAPTPTPPLRRPHGPAKVTPAVPQDAYRPAASPAARLEEVNLTAFRLLGRALKSMATHPGKAFASFGSFLVEPFLHPGQAFARCKTAFTEDDAIQGVLFSALYVSTAVTTASFAVMALALLAAPFTGGASLAVAAGASQVMIWTGLHDAGVTAALLVKDEVDALRATTDERRAHEAGQLADDFLNTFFAWVTLPLSDATTALTAAPQGLWTAARASIKPAASRAARRAVGVGSRSGGD